MNKVFINLACKLYYFMDAAGLNTQKFSSTGSSGISFFRTCLYYRRINILIPSAVPSQQPETITAIRADLAQRGERRFRCKKSPIEIR